MRNNKSANFYFAVSRIFNLFLFLRLLSFTFYPSKNVVHVVSAGLPVTNYGIGLVVVKTHACGTRGKKSSMRIKEYHSSGSRKLVTF